MQPHTGEQTNLPPSSSSCAILIHAHAFRDLASESQTLKTFVMGIPQLRIQLAASASHSGSSSEPGFHFFLILYLDSHATLQQRLITHAVHRCAKQLVECSVAQGTASSFHQPLPDAELDILERSVRVCGEG
mmetsp:Transcript_45401/g.76463  ORF Transcript_45401/g.76463 Transcript_45401/m.76463 type:complete len:132 (-) Transcript_45401:618-1013(-)